MVSQNNQPLVSVVIPTYNRFEKVQEAIESVLKQTYNNYEIIVVDDGSTQPLTKLKIKYPKIKVIRHEVNQGSATARNTGFNASTGKYIALLDSDDQWIDSKLAKQVALLEGNIALDMSTTGYFYNTEEGNSIEIPKQRNNWHRYFCTGGGLAAGSTLIAKKECLQDVQYDHNFRRLTDIDLMLRLAEKYSLIIIAQPLATIFRAPRPSARSVEQANLDFIAKHHETFRKYGYFFTRYCEGKRLLETSIHFFREKNRKQGWYYFTKAILKNPIQRPGMYLRIFDYLTGISTMKALKRLLNITQSDD